MNTKNQIAYIAFTIGGLSILVLTAVFVTHYVKCIKYHRISHNYDHESEKYCYYYEMELALITICLVLLSIMGCIFCCKRESTSMNDNNSNLVMGQVALTPITNSQIRFD